ncbi:MAG TPA: bifunctional YncE family protein/alkaline phosphatase family protein [Terriglobia bacterium]|nr:bifunctional YncE family protein/alkaline phosphatase family protein [Terriglobia bacterium]
MKLRSSFAFGSVLVAILTGATTLSPAQDPAEGQAIHLPSSKTILRPVPGRPQKTNSFPTTLALSPDGKFLAGLNNGYGTEESGYQQSIAVVDLKSNQMVDYPDSRLGKRARQTYFLGLAFSADGKHLYASVASLTDLTGHAAGDTGNGIAVYGFEDGRPTPQRFIKIPPQPLGAARHPAKVSNDFRPAEADPYPAGLAVVTQGDGEKILAADNLSDDALLLDAASGKIIHRFDLSTPGIVPASYPYGVVVARDGKRAYCSLWNASQVAELDLESGRVTRRIPVLAPKAPTAAGSHPTAMLLSPDEKYLYVALSNADRVAVIQTATGKLAGLLSCELPGEKFGGVYPMALAQTVDGSRLFVADASADAVAVFDMTRFKAGQRSQTRSPQTAIGFIPTEWYPTALAVERGDLFIATGKGKGTGPNAAPLPTDQQSGDSPRGQHPYIVALIHGSLARVNIRIAESSLAKLTDEVVESNGMRAPQATINFAAGNNPIRHVIYIIKENRTYDQILGDLKPGDGDASLCMYGEDITPNEHKLALQFGILDNFYDSGEVSGDGHVWSMAAITSDYTEKTWEISYRGAERLYDYEGEVSRGYPLREGRPDVNEPGTGYIWSNVARHGLTHRNYGEFVSTQWCSESAPAQPAPQSPKEGTPEPAGRRCAPAVIHPGQQLPANVGQPHGSPSPWPWAIPLISRDVATKPELENHFDPRFPDFNLDYPDQLRADEFLNEFDGFVRARKENHGTGLPQFVILRLPDDHTAGTRPGAPQPMASVADNDLAVGRVVEAVSRSPYWDDTAIFILEDDAQDGPDHVDAHRSIAFVISKYSPGSPDHPAVDHHFYTTVSMIRTMESLLGLPPMNNNDAWAPVMAPLFAGPGNQPGYTADFRNRDNGVIYRVNSPHAPGARASAAMDFTHADAADSTTLNAILWKDRKGDQPMPAARHTVIHNEK